MEDFSRAFEERLKEIEAYLDLLDALQKQVQSGLPQLGDNGITITVQQQKILYSSVYLQLYSLVESTITRCVDAMTTVIVNKKLQPNDLSKEFLSEWVRFTARTHIDLNYDNRLESVLGLCDHFVNSLPISEFEVQKGGGGNWDDKEIYRLSQRLGLTMTFSSETQRLVKQPLKDGHGALSLIKTLRNQLAHGNISFSECSEGVTAGDLRDLTDRTANYLREVITCFQDSIDSNIYLLPEKRRGLM
ncbi:MAG: MAE_28990/MAE_18760 family HEPN-like nuclease [Crocosphaera sp.]